MHRLPARLATVEPTVAGPWLEPPDVTPPPAHRRTVTLTPDPGAPTETGAIDLAGFDTFYRRSRTELGRALTLALGDRDLAVEAVDEAFTRAYERWSTLQELDRPEGWVYRVAMNWSLSVLRRRRRGHHRFYDPNRERAETSVSDPAVEAALAELDAKQRSVVVCRHLLGWSVAETAAALGVREGTVKSRLHRAHLILKSHLSHLEDQS